MPILKSVTTPQGVPCGYHKPVSGEYSFADGVVVIRVASFYDQATHDAGAGAVWVWPVTLPISQAADVETAMLTAEGSPFAGGSLLVAQTATP